MGDKQRQGWWIKREKQKEREKERSSSRWSFSFFIKYDIGQNNCGMT